MFTWGFIYLAAGIISTIFILGIPLFIKAPKNQPTIIRIIGIALSFSLLISVTFLLLNENYEYEYGRVLPVIRSVYVALAPLIFSCFFLQALFIRSIRRSILDIKVLIIFLLLVGLFSLAAFFFYSYIDSTEGSYVDLKTVFSFYRGLIFSCLIIWFFYELREVLKTQKDFILLLMQILCGLFLLQSIAWVIFLAMDYQANGAIVSEFGGISKLDTNVRMIRIGIFCTFEILLSIYWVQHYSLNAIEERQKQEKIQQLLQEKDVLIERLSNSSTLIESGALSAGLAHELNQFLGRIALNRDEIVQLISQSKVKPDELKLPLDNILQANQSAASLIVSLRKLFSRGEEDAVSCNPDDLVKDVVSLYVARIRKSNIEIVLDLQVSKKQLIWESLFRQVVVNLLANAIEALDASSRSGKVIHVQSAIDEDGDYRLQITDNGPGINAQQEDKIFSLFSTSKSSGTGIGLWLSRYIVERHKGLLLYKNLPDKGGVSFILKIPSGNKG